MLRKGGVTRRPTTASFALALITAIITLYLLYSLRHAWLVTYVAIVLAVMFDPAVRLVGRLRVGRWHPGRGMSVAGVAIAFLVLIAAIALFIVPPIVGDASNLERQGPQMLNQAIDWIHQHLPFSSSVTIDSLTHWVRQMAGGGAPFLAVGGSVLDTLSILLIAVYLLSDVDRILPWCLSFVPSGRRDDVHKALVKGAHRMQSWVGGQGILMLTHGGSALVTFWLIGLPYFFAIAVFAAVINIIPFLGPILTLVVAGLVAAIQAPSKLLAVVIFYLVYHNIEGTLLQPRIMSRAVGVPGVTVVVSLLVGYEIAGIVGMLVSVPTAVLIAELKSDLMK